MSNEVLVRPAAGNRILRGAKADGVLSVELGELAPARVIEEAVAEARGRGQRDGYAAGLAAAEAAVSAESLTRQQATASLVAALDGAARSLRAQRAQEADEIGPAVAAAVFELVELILGRELALSADAGSDALARALAAAPEGAAVAHLHPEDVATLQADAPDVLASSRDLTIVANPSVERGGCWLDVGPCRIDASLSAAVARAREAFA